MSETNTTKRPEVIRNRVDAVELWKHLLERGISFHWEDDPAGWVDDRSRQVLTTDEVQSVRRLFAEVEGLDNPGCYDDAVSLQKCALLLGTESITRVPPEHASAFARCGSVTQATRILQRLQ